LADGKGGKAEKTFSFKAGHSGGSVLLRTDKVIYDVGDTMKISVFAPDQKDRIYLDVIKKYQTIMMKSLDLSGGKAELEIDIDESMAGDILLDSYYLTYSGQIIRDKKIVFVKNAGSLNLEVKSEKEVYLPGEEAKINFKVTDGEGNGKPSAIGIQIVDEAVFALSENKPGLLKLYFELEDEIASPKYEIHGAHFDLSSIVTTNPENEKEAETLDTKAKAAFAALMETGFSGEYSSWKEAQKEIAQLLNPHYQKHKEQVIQYLRELYQKGELNDKTIKDFLANQKVFYDYWGNLYVFEVPDNYTMKMSSAGLDEVMGTGDDWSANVSIYEIYGWWEEDFMGNGIPGAAQDAAMNEPFDDPNKKTGGGEEPKIRKYFPETLYVNPALITDEKGEAVLSVMMADSITEWRVSSLASDAFGKLGSNVTGVKVFMDFFVDLDLPRTMTRGDEVSFPVVVYNYLKGDQTVKLELMSDDWFELKGAAEQTLTLKEGEVKSTNFPIKVKDVGWHGLTVKAYGDGASDAVMRLVEIVPDGTEIRESVSGKLAGVVHQKLNFPAEIIPNTENLIVKIYPGVLSQAVEGLDSILKMPSGCFEQTTSTCWPNVLVLDYMMTSGQVTPEIELKAREFVNVGYQRLLTYECTGGGFTWFGDPNPANVILSAIGVMEFSDMAKVHEIDENVIKRTQDFLAKKQAADGSWSENQGSEFATVQYDTLITTCFVTWSLASSEYQGGSADSGIGYITANLDDAASTYSYAMCANAFASHNPNSSKTMEVLNELLDRRIEEGDLVHWENEGGNTNYYYGEGGSSTNIEVTALAVLALLEAGAAPDIVSGAINYLVTKKDSFGNWNTTHATILTLKAFVKSLSAMVQDADGVVAIEVNGTQVTPLVV
ncbi:MAG: hypothetical protein FJ088_05455, partial [Deltaproteobacteria bacterium]|nr:hypothetical protein [Deltaproteobacteria bacterium]